MDSREQRRGTASHAARDSASDGSARVTGVSQRAYARLRGVRLSAVQKAIVTKRITLNPDGTIDPATADGDWDRNTFAERTLDRKSVV